MPFLSVCDDCMGGFNLLYSQVLGVVDVLAAHSVLILPGKQLLMAAYKFYPTVFLSALTTVHPVLRAGNCCSLWDVHGKHC